MRRAGEARDGNCGPFGGIAVFRRTGVTLGLAMAFALSVPAAAVAATIDVDEQGESATFVTGDSRPAGYFDRIKDLSDHNGHCSLREAIEASNTNTEVDSCPAGTGPGDVLELPAGSYDLYDNLIVLERVTVRGANAGLPGNDPHRGPETVITLVNNPDSVGQPALFWLGAPSPGGPTGAGGSRFNGLTLAGNSNPLCVETGTLACEEWAIVQPEKSAGGPNTAPGLKLRNSIVRDFTAGLYIGGERTVIARNLFKNNSALINTTGGVNAGIDVYSDATYTNLNPVVVRNVFANPAVAAVVYQGYNSAEVVSGGLIRGNLVNLPSTAGYAVLLLNTLGQRIQDNVIRDPSPPALETRTFPYGVRLDGVRDLEISGNTVTGLGTALRVNNLGVPFSIVGVTDVRVTNNRIYGNRYGIRVGLPYQPLSIDARANWWGANGGAGSSGARPGAVNPVNGLRFEDANGAAPNPGGIDTAQPLQLGCSMPANVTANTPVPLTGRVPGMPAVDRTASMAPWFEGVHDPLMDASVSGVSGRTFGFGRPPRTGVFAGQLVPGGGSLTGVLVPTAVGAGAGQVALDSEQVACPFQAAPVDLVIHKTTKTRFARPGDLVTYRITVRNRGDAPVRALRSCDRAPRALRFVRSTLRVRRAAGRRRCLMIRVLRPGQRKTFRATFRVRANVTADTVTNGAIASTNNSSGGNRRQRRHARDAATIGVRRAEPRGCPAAASPRAQAAC
jgi:uncharacterized repeat protein (TIGR01451 family)